MANMKRWIALVGVLSGCGSRSAPDEDCACGADWVCCPGGNVCALDVALCPLEEQSDLGVDGSAGLEPSGGSPDASTPAGDGGNPSVADGGDAAEDAGTGSAVDCATGRLCWYWPAGTGDDFLGVWGRSADDLWLTTDTGSLVHYDGEQLELVYQHPEPSSGGPLTGFLEPDGEPWLWFPINMNGRSEMMTYQHGWFLPDLAPALPPLHAMATAGRSVWAVGSEAAVEAWAYGGWSDKVSTGGAGHRSFDPGLNPKPDLVAVWGTSKLDVWGMDAKGVVYHGGRAVEVWSEHPDDDVSSADRSRQMRAIGIGGSAPDDVWAIHEDTALGTVFRHFDGSTWTRSVMPCSSNASSWGPRALPRVWSGAAGDLWVTGDHCRDVWHWDGAEWHLYPPVREREIRYDAVVHEMPWSDGRTVLMAGQRGSLARLTADGAWESLRDPGPRNVWALAVLGDDELYAAIDYDLVHMRDGEQTRLPETMQGEIPTSLHALGSSDLWMAGTIVGWSAYTGVFAHWDGERWDRVEHLDQPATIVAARGPEMWLQLDGGGMRYWRGDGWAALPLEGDVGAVATTAELTWYALRGEYAAEGDRPATLYRQEAGKEPVALPWPWRGVEVSSLFAVGAELWVSGGTGMLHYDGAAWHTRALPERYGAGRAWGTEPDDLWFVGAALDGHRASVLHWDGVSFRRDVNGTPGRQVYSIGGSDRYVFLGSNGILRGRR